MEFTLDQNFIEVFSGEGVEVGDYISLITYPSNGPLYILWGQWVKVLEVREEVFIIRFPSGYTTFSHRKRSHHQNKWVKKIITKEYRVNQEPLDDEETL